MFALVLAVPVGSQPRSTASVSAPGVEDFFRKPQYGGARLSPGGRYLAAIVPVGEHLGLGIIDLDKRVLVQRMDAGDGDVLRIVWQTDERLIVILGDLQQVAGEPPRERGIVAINRDGSDARVIAGNDDTAFVTSRRQIGRRPFERSWSLTLDRTIPESNEILITVRDRSLNSLDLYRYDTLTDTRTLLSFESPGNASRWIVDFDNVPRAVVTDDIDHDTSAWYVRKSGAVPWTKVEEAKHGRLPSVPLQFDPDGKILYVATRRNGADRAAIFEYHLETGRWGDAAIRHPERDVDNTNAGFVADYKSRRLLGVTYASDRPSVEWFDAQRARIQKSIDSTLPDSVNEIQGDRAGKRWIVVARSDRNPGDVYLLDGTTLRMEKLYSYEPRIDPARMATTKWVRYSARDGLSIPALLTMPARALDGPPPLIVDIHGGPYVEATVWGYDPAVQFLASRGYAVLQPQFRGTSGFGWKHYSSGFGKWGAEMQDDLEDGVKCAVAQGLVDSSRVCFFGGSYGGYAAIWGTIKNAALIKCSVAAVAVTSIDYLFDNAQTDIARLAERSTLMSWQIGDPKTDRARFKRVSPLDNADKVQAPILLAYGGSDLRVPIVHGTDFRSALDRYGKEYEWVQYSNEGHGFNRDVNVFDFYQRVERFLAKNLRGKNAEAPAVPSSK